MTKAQPNIQTTAPTTAPNILSVLPYISVSHQKNLENIHRRSEFIGDALKHFKNSSIDEEARTIKMLFYQNEAVNKNLIEIRTKNWLKLGIMLNLHRKKVEAASHIWSEWAVEHFPFLKQRRREMAMELDNFGSKVENYLYMGIDRLYDLFHKLNNYQTDPDFKLIAKRFGYMFKITPETEETKADKNRNADKIRGFFKFKEHMKNVPFDRELLLDVIEAGGMFGKSDYDHFKKLNSSPQAIDEYLLKTLCNGGTPKGRSIKPAAKDSIQVILAMLIETVDEFEASKAYPKVSKSLFNAAKERMFALENHI